MPPFSRILVLSVFAAIAPISAAVQAPAPIPSDLSPGLAQVARDFDQIATAAASNPNDVGYSVGVFTASGLAWTRSYGFSDAARRTPASADSVYRVGSGALTTVMLLQLIHAGTVHFSEPITKYVPELASARAPYAGAPPATLIQIATHTSGLEPGTHAEVSPAEDAILALALSRAARQSYEPYVTERILKPLGMTHTSFDGSAEQTATDRPMVLTTIGDLARLGQLALLAGPESVIAHDDLEANYRRQWVVNSVAVPNPSEGFGVGFEGETWTSNRLSHYYFILPIGDTGSGYDAALWFEPRTHCGVILLHQGNRTPALGQMIHTYVYTLNAEPRDAGPQKPAQPLPYADRSITIDIGNGAVLAGTLTVPAGAGPFPAAILIPKGPGLDRDELLLNHRPFLVLADALARRGIAVLRTDGRGVGHSTGGPASRDSFVADVGAATAFLKTRPEIDPQRIGLIGHGDGGIAASVAANRQRDVAFVVLLGTAATPAADNLVEATRLAVKGNGDLPERADEQAAATQARLQQQTSPAVKQQLTDDPAVELRRLTCPVLALYGGKDLSVPASLNVGPMRTALAAGGHSADDVVVVPDVNLLFQTADVGIGREANWTEETMSPAVLARVTTWIASLRPR
jgi:CubicO group peptidase (beta-lactamase class C family)/pimeloyl-ACP methyl ester carboxylesterase